MDVRYMNALMWAAVIAVPVLVVAGAYFLSSKVIKRVRRK